jgi:putative RecB family exonuclease
VLGTALHQALEQFYRDWHYLDPLPDLAWLERCWLEHAQALTLGQHDEGWHILQTYYERFVQSQTALRRPLATESRIQGRDSRLAQSNLCFQDAAIA